MVVKRSRGYQDIEDSSNNSQTYGRNELPDPDTIVPQEIEMASVSVVPDGNYTFRRLFELINFVVFKIRLLLPKLLMLSGLVGFK